MIDSNKEGKCLLLDNFKYRTCRVWSVVGDVWLKIGYNMQSNEESTKNTHKQGQVETVKIKIKRYVMNVNSRLLMAFLNHHEKYFANSCHP